MAINAAIDRCASWSCWSSGATCSFDEENEWTEAGVVFFQCRRSSSVSISISIHPGRHKSSLYGEMESWETVHTASGWLLRRTVRGREKLLLQRRVWSPPTIGSSLQQHMRWARELLRVSWKRKARITRISCRICCECASHYSLGNPIRMCL
jgi:hypothetical protein